jgi:hypothetical protein
MKEIWKRRERIEKERGGGYKEKYYFLELFYVYIQLQSGIRKPVGQIKHSLFRINMTSSSVSESHRS